MIPLLAALTWTAPAPPTALPRARSTVAGFDCLFTGTTAPYASAVVDAGGWKITP